MPQNACHTVLLTFDFDALCVWLADKDSVTPAELSRGEFGARVGVPRILKLLAAYELSATFFVPGHTADSFPQIVAQILENGHEIAHHGYGHEDPSAQSADEERRSLERGIAALSGFLGHAPLGYRSPSWDYSDSTLSLLEEFGFLYDSSLFAEDFRPYRPRLGDQVSADVPLRRGRAADIWEFPVDFSLDDWPHFTFKFDPLRVGLSSPSKVLTIWAGDFDYMAANEENGVLTITMHPQVIGRGHRMLLLEQFIQHVLANGSARFARMGDVAKELNDE